MLRVAVQDANILIDLEIAGLFDLWFQNGIETHTTDLIEGQLEEGGHAIALAYIRTNHVRCHGLSVDEIGELVEMMEAVGEGPDLADCSVLWLAERLECMLLTGDGPLRRAGVGRSVEIHGTLWILDTLVQRGLLEERLAASKLEHLLQNKRRLPKAECDARLKKWKKRG